MEERIDAPKRGRFQSNITRFRQDKRLAVVGLLHSLALLGMLLILVFCIFRFHENLSPERLSRLLSDFKAANTVADPFSEYRFEAGLRTVYAPLGSGLAVSSGDAYSYVSGLGSSAYSIQLGYTNAALCVSDKYVLVYDRGNTGFCVASSYAEYLRGDAGSPILSASMNRDGAFALVTDENGYRSAVSVYNTRQKLLCQWLTSQYYTLMASVSPDSRSFAALTLSQTDLTLSTQVRYFRIGDEEPAWTAELGTRQVYSMTHDKSGGLVILWDGGLFRYDEKGNQTASLTFASPLQRFAASEEGDLLLAFSSADRSAQYVELWVVGDQGELLCKKSFSGVLRAAACSGGTAALLLGDRVEAVSYTEEGQPVRAQSQSGARDLLTDREGACILVYSDRAEKVDFSAEP